MVDLEFGKRLGAALSHARVPDDRERRKKVAKQFGVSSEAVRKWLAGETKPKDSRLQKLARELDVNYEWLATGRGEMYSDIRKDSSVYQTPNVRDLLFYFDHLTSDQQNAVLEQMKEMKLTNDKILKELSARRISKDPAT